MILIKPAEPQYVDLTLSDDPDDDHQTTESEYIDLTLSDKNEDEKKQSQNNKSKLIQKYQQLLKLNHANLSEISQNLTDAISMVYIYK